MATEETEVDPAALRVKVAVLESENASLLDMLRGMRRLTTTALPPVRDGEPHFYLFRLPMRGSTRTFAETLFRRVDRVLKVEERAEE